jgi:hypothetical protein
MKRAHEKLLVKPSCTERPQHVGDASTMRLLQNSSGSEVESSRALQRAELEKCPSPLEEPRRSCVDPRHWNKKL